MAKKDEGDDKEEKGAGKEATEALKALLLRIGEIFGVFDLSFFVAGSVCFGAGVFAVYVFGGEGWARERIAEAKDWKAIHVGAVILACYVLGMFCFALGNTRRRRGKPYENLPAMLAQLGIYEPYRPLAVADDRGDLLYTRLWVEMRQRKELAPSFNLVMRYWVMSAMCDGLVVAWGAWALLWGAWAVLPWLWPRLCEPGPATSLKGLAAVAFALMAYFCLQEAKRYSRYQMYEIVATLGYFHNPDNTARSAAPPPAAPTPAAPTLPPPSPPAPPPPA